MIQIQLKEVPKKYIEKFKRKYIEIKTKEYEKMGINYNLTDLQIDEDINDFFSKCLFFHNQKGFSYFYCKPIKF